MGNSEDMGTGTGTGNGNGNATSSPDLSSLMGVGPSYYLPPTSGRNDDFGGDDDWNYT